MGFNSGFKGLTITSSGVLLHKPTVSQALNKPPANQQFTEHCVVTVNVEGWSK